MINYLHKAEQKGEEINKADIAASFQAAVVDVLCEHTIEAAKKCHRNVITLAGGVASNSALRKRMTEEAEKEGISVLYPPPVLCTDNAAMIGCAGYYGYLAGQRADLSLNAVPSLPLS